MSKTRKQLDDEAAEAVRQANYNPRAVTTGRLFTNEEFPLRNQTYDHLFNASGSTVGIENGLLIDKLEAFEELLLKDATKNAAGRRHEYYQFFKQVIVKMMENTKNDEKSAMAIAQAYDRQVTENLDFKSQTDMSLQLRWVDAGLSREEMMSKALRNEQVNRVLLTDPLARTKYNITDEDDTILRKSMMKHTIGEDGIAKFNTALEKVEANQKYQEHLTSMTTKAGQLCGGIQIATAPTLETEQQ